MATFTNKVFKPRKDSGFVIKFRANDKAAEKLSHDPYIIKYYSKVSFKDTVYFGRTFFTLHGIKSLNNLIPWCYGKDVIVFIYKVNDYDFPCAAYVNGEFVEFENLSNEDRDVYRSYSGSYVEDVCPLWVREPMFTKTLRWV